MRAVRYHQWQQDPQLDDLPEPVRAPGEILVSIQAAGLSHLDLTVASGTFAFHPELPYVGGGEASAVVLEADDLAPGTQVLLRGAGLGLIRDGCWRERASVSPKAVSELAQPLPPPVAASFFMPATTAYVALHDVAALGDGERVIVGGAAGAIGSLITQLALNHGAEVIGVVGRAHRRDGVPAGATAISMDDRDAVDALAKSRDVSLLVDTLGGAGLAERMRWVRPGGRAVAIGYGAGTETTIALRSWLLEDVALLPVNMIRREARAREVSAELVRDLAAGRLSLPVETYPVDQAAFALRRVGAGEARVRAVLEFP